MDVRANSQGLPAKMDEKQWAETEAQEALPEHEEELLHCVGDCD